jgi:hypothetical protein
LECSSYISQPHTTAGINICCKQQAGNFMPILSQKKPSIVPGRRECHTHLIKLKHKQGQNEIKMVLTRCLPKRSTMQTNRCSRRPQDATLSHAK